MQTAKQQFAAGTLEMNADPPPMCPPRAKQSNKGGIFLAFLYHNPEQRRQAECFLKEEKGGVAASASHVNKYMSEHYWPGADKEFWGQKATDLAREKGRAEKLKSEMQSHCTRASQRCCIQLAYFERALRLECYAPVTGCKSTRLARTMQRAHIVL